MNTIEQIVKNEPLVDIVTAFGIGLAYPSLDRMFSKYRFEVIADGELLRVYTELFQKGVLANGEGPIALKGPNWKAPQFVREKRYIK